MKALEFLKDIASKQTITNKIVLLPLGQRKFGCHNHRDLKGRTYVETHVFCNSKDFEITCTCGIVYRRSKDYKPVEDTINRIITL